MDTIRSPLLRVPPSGAFGSGDDPVTSSARAGSESPPGVRRLHAAPRHGLFRSWGLLLAAIVIGLMIALLGYDRPTSVRVGDPAAASGPVASAGGQIDGPGIADDKGTVASADDASNQTSASAASAGAVVHVVGQVAQPGVLTLPIGARVADAVTAAGGALPDADLSGLNLARRVNDGEQIVVTGPVPPANSIAAGESGGAPGDAGSAAGLINLNRATSADLEELPRVGPVTAEKIIAYREQNGPFTAVDQLLEVPGIGEGTLAGLRDLVTV